MRVYVDSSALLKRSIDEAESEALEAALDGYVDDDAVMISSSLAWIEVSRALRTLLDDDALDDDEAHEAISVALSGVAERAITEDVVSLARRIAPPRLRTLDAIHVATAVLLDADVVLTYDGRLAAACRHHGLAVVAP
ncbi:type II toxin-antitoxin system VapC family toxin [soil metagenome]